MNRVIDRLAQVLSSTPDPPLGSGNIGARQPSTSGELPALVISLRIDDARGNGLGGFVREGNSPAKSTSTIIVAASQDTFTPSLKTLRISQLPIIRNPDSTSQSFSAQDIQIRNITVGGSPVEYQFTDAPALANQFRVNRSSGEIVFGQSQNPGDRLELVHWTMTWRDDIYVERFNGLITLDAWASTFDDLNGIIQRTITKLRGLPESLRQKGFRRLQPGGISPAVQSQWEPAVGAAVLICRQTLEYRFTAEIEDGGEISSGGVIRRIDVAIDETVNDRFSIPSSAGSSPNQ